MGRRNFNDLLKGQWDKGHFLCIGLDSDLEKIPESIRERTTRETIVAFNRALIDETHDIVCAYKPNSAFYEAHGDEGWAAMRETIQYIRGVAPEVPVILDAKRADIGNTNCGYVEAAYENLQADAVTVHPYFGSEAIAPFLEREDRGVFVLCRTSNPGAGEVQDLPVGNEPLYKHIARMVAEKWNAKGNCGIVAGATYPDELREIRAIVGYLPILIPGIGAQGGKLKESVAAGRDSKRQGVIVSSSRAIIFASPHADFAKAARKEAEELHGAIARALLE